MSYGLYTVGRDELRDVQALGRKLQTATGEYEAAVRLAAELARAAQDDTETSTWRIMPAPEASPGHWRVEPVRGA